MSYVHPGSFNSKRQRLLTAIVCFVPMFALAQSANYQVPRTVDGVPDLQGMWTNNTITPLTRPVEFGNKLVLSAEEAFALEQEVAEYTEQVYRKNKRYLLEAILSR